MAFIAFRGSGPVRRFRPRTTCTACQARPATSSTTADQPTPDTIQRPRGQPLTVTASRSADARGGSVLRTAMTGPGMVRLSAAALSVVVDAVAPSFRK